MATLIQQPWLYFCIAFGVMLLATLLMGMEGKKFYTKDPVRRNFSMLEMEFPGKEDELPHLIRGIYRLPPEAVKTIRAVRAQLYLDYLLFIPAAYGSIFLLCMKVSCKMHQPFGAVFFKLIAWGQSLSFILDYIENTYFLILIKQREPDIQTESAFILMRILEFFKWGFSLIGGICGLAAIAYYWISGEYAASSLCYIWIFFSEIGVFVVARYFISRLGKQPLNDE